VMKLNMLVNFTLENMCSFEVACFANMHLPAAGKVRLNTMQCWQKQESTITLVTTLNLALHVENTSEFQS